MRFSKEQVTDRIFMGGVKVGRTDSCEVVDIGPYCKGYITPKTSTIWIASDEENFSSITMIDKHEYQVDSPVAPLSYMKQKILMKATVDVLDFMEANS